ncbi:MAG: PilN domain-containing protein [Burkholderiales bacterium]
MSQQINLFNPIFRKQEVLLSLQHATAILLTIAVVAGAGSAYRYYQAASLTKETNALAAELASQQTILDEMSARRSTGKSKLLEAEIARIESKTQEDQKILSLLKGGDLGDTKGYSSYMAGFARQITAGVWLTGFDIVGAGRHMTIQGMTTQADRVPAYLTRLNQEPVLRGKTFSSLELRLPPKEKGGDGENRQTGTGSYIEFQISSEELKDKPDTPAAPAPSSVDHAVEVGNTLNEQSEKYNEQAKQVAEQAKHMKETLKTP